MLTLTVRHLTFDDMPYASENVLQGPWALVSEQKHIGTQHELDAIIEEYEDHDWGSHFYDFDDNARTYDIS